MVRWSITTCLLALVAWATSQAVLAQPASAWVFDEVTLKNGSQFQGVILKESTNELEFQVVIRRPGRPTLTLISVYNIPQEVASVKRLTPAERSALRMRLTELELDPGGSGEQKRMESLDLFRTKWLGKSDAAHLYTSERFVLISGASEEITRRAAVRLEQIYSAFARYLPPHYNIDQPVTVFLAGQVEDYRKLIGPTAGTLLNRAIYEPTLNRIICGNDLRQLGEELSSTQKKHAQESTKLDRYEKEIRQLYRNSPTELDRFLIPLSQERKRIAAANFKNNETFNHATKQLFALLYHEAFHSYVATYVYPARSIDEVRMGKGTGELPRWLNEGYAQIFETAVIEAGELRVGHADKERLDRLQPIKKAKMTLLPVAELLRAGKDSFLAAHSDQKSITDRVYLTSWAVTFYLTFERRLVGTKEFTTFLTAVNTGQDPVQAFEKWVGKDVQSFDQDLLTYIARLLPDGTLAPPLPERDTPQKQQEKN